MLERHEVLPSGRKADRESWFAESYTGRSDLRRTVEGRPSVILERTEGHHR